MRVELCGPMGIGKTTLAKKLSSLAGWRLLQEPVETHPFLQSFYQQPQAFAFEKNLFFLMDYMHQIKRRSTENTVFDHSAVVHRSYAALNGIATAENPVFLTLNKVIERLGPPDLLINLICPPDLIIERIRQRGREFESGIEVDYIIALNDEIQRQVAAIEHYVPVMHIDAACQNFDKNYKDVLDTYRSIKARLNNAAPTYASHVPEKEMSIAV